MTKQEAMQILSALPDDVSFDEIIYRLSLINDIRQGQKDIDEGRFFTTEQVKAVFDQQ